MCFVYIYHVFSLIHCSQLVIVTAGRYSVMPDYLFLGFLKWKPCIRHMNIQVIFKSIFIAFILKYFFFYLRVPL